MNVLMDCIYDWFLWMFPKPATENQPNEEDNNLTSSVHANESDSAVSVSPGKGEESNLDEELDHYLLYFMHSEKKEKNDSIFFNFAIILTQLISYSYLLVKKSAK